MSGAGERQLDVVFAGGGLASVLAAAALRRRDPRVRIALVEREQRLGGNHTWCFHGSDLDQEGQALLRPFVDRSWSGSEVMFPGLRRRLTSSYHAVTSARLDEVGRELFARPGSVLVTGAAIESVRADEVVLADGRRLGAPLVVDARGPAPRDAWEATGFQKFLGLELELEGPCGREVPLLMDATAAQQDGFRFFYVLPLEPTRVLVEETFFSSTPGLDAERVRASIAAYVAHNGWRVRRILREERGLLPMPYTLDGAPPLASPLRLGLQGGWFHPATAYSLPIAARTAAALAAGPLREAPQRLQELWREHHKQARYATYLNRLLFRAVEPSRRREVFARFFTLPEATIGRFFALEMTAWDRARVLCGRPPAGMSVGDVLFPKEVQAC